MRGARWQVMLVPLAVLAAGCSSADPRPASEQPQEAAPTQAPPSATQEPISQAQQASLDRFLAKTKPVTRVRAEFELREVQYTSPTDAVAQFLNQYRPNVKAAEAAEVIMTTDDNWTHASGLSISDDLADLVSYVPLGRGAVAIKARNQFNGKAYPPFVLYPNGEVKPLLVATEPRSKAWNSYPLAQVDDVLTKKKGCLMMHKQVVFWPHGTQWDQSKQAVVFDDGSEALVGEVFTGKGGSYDTTVDFESFLESESAAAKIARCVRVTGASHVLVAAP